MIIGQSNSVLKTGFAAHLSKISGVKIISKGALGASSAILGPYFLLKYPNLKADYLLIDLCVYDAHAIHTSDGMYGSYEFGKYFEYMIMQARIMGCIPVIVALYPQWAILKHHQQFNTYRLIAERNLCPYIDFRDFLYENFDVTEETLASLYDDPNHPGDRVQAEFAAAIAEFMLHDNNFVKSEITSSTPEYESICLTKESGVFEIVNRSTSIVHANFARMKTGDYIDVEVRPDRIIRGFVVNTTQCNAKLRFLGDIEVVKDLRISVGDSDAPARLQVAPIYTCLRPRRSRVSLSICGDDINATEKHLSATKDLPGEPMCEVADLIAEISPIVKRAQGLVPLTAEACSIIKRTAR